MMPEQEFITPTEYKESTDDDGRVFRHSYFADGTSVTELASEQLDEVILSINDRGTNHLVDPRWGRYPFSARVMITAAYQMMEKAGYNES